MIGFQKGERSMNENLLHVGIDIGSTTVKVVVLDHQENLLFSDYQRHFADILKTLNKILEQAESVIENHSLTVTISLLPTLKT